MTNNTYANKYGHGDRNTLPNAPANFDSMAYTDLKKRHATFVNELDEGISLEREDISEVLDDYAKDLKTWHQDMDLFERENDCSMHQNEIKRMKKDIDRAITNILSGVR